MDSGGLEIWVWSTIFQKSNIGWPQQPPIEKVLKFNMIFHDSTKMKIFQNIKMNEKFENLDDSEVLNSDFPGQKTSAGSMTSTASTTSVASMTFTASFHQKILILIVWSSLAPTWPIILLVEWIIKNPNFHWYLNPLCQRLLRPANVTFLKTGWSNSNFQTSWPRYAPNFF